MKIDTEHLHYWMQAIRQSPDPMRTMDAFWQGQIKSKEWLIEKVRPLIFKEFIVRKISIEIHGGWVGLLASLMFQSDIPVDKIISIDIDNNCEEIAKNMNKKEEMEGRFLAITDDMCLRGSECDVLINTSCEHLSQDKYNSWLSVQKENKFLVLQSNNYQIDEHVRCATSLEEFVEQSSLSEILYKGELQLPLYTRYMIIGKK